jgi:hypothetical protein
MASAPAIRDRLEPWRSVKPSVLASSGTGRSVVAVSRVAEVWLSGSQPSWFPWLGRLPCNPRTCTR